MISAVLAGLPLQLVCQLIVSESRGLNNTNFAVNQPLLPQFQPENLPADSKTVLLATLPLKLVCRLIPTSNSDVTENRSSVQFETRIEIPSANLPEGYVAFHEDHAAYKIYKKSTKWDDARERCVSEGARLAITDSREKIAHINSLKTDWESEWLHVGIYKSNTTNEWVRIDNQLRVTSMPWAENNPDGTGNCAGISFVENGLVDYVCDWSGEYYVCEILI